MNTIRQFLRNHWLDVSFVIALLGGIYWVGSTDKNVVNIEKHNADQDKDIESLQDQFRDLSMENSKLSGQIEILRDIVTTNKVSFRIDSPSKLKIALEMFNDKRFKLEGKLEVAKKALESIERERSPAAGGKLYDTFNKLSKDGLIEGVISTRE